MTDITKIDKAAIGANVMLITSVVPGQARIRDEVAYTGVNLGLVTQAFFEDSRGAIQHAQAFEAHDGKSATSKVPPGLEKGHGKTWLMDTDKNTSNSLPIDIITS